MARFTLFRNKKENETEKRDLDSGFSFVDSLLGTLRFTSYSNYTQSKALKISTVYRCVNLISDSIASLPLYPYLYDGNWKKIDYNNSLYNILNIQPNNFIGAFNFKKQIVVNVLLSGNAYVYIERDKQNKILSLTLLNPDAIEIIVENNDIKYKNNTTKSVYDKSQIIHISNYTTDGLRGVSTITYAATSLGIAYDSDQHTSNFFKSGASLSGILRPVAGTSINKVKAAQAKEDFLNTVNTDLGGSSGSIVVLGDGLEYQPISINPKDSQLLESRQFNVIDVCRFFNVPPSLAFSETGKFSTAEQQQLDFVNNTLMPWLEKIENEFYRKLYLSSQYDTTELKFDVENLLRTDLSSKADYFVKMYQIGAYTTNEIRQKINSEFPVAGGNRAFIQVNLQPIDNLISEQKNNITQ